MLGDSHWPATGRQCAMLPLMLALVTTVCACRPKTTPRAEPPTAPSVTPTTTPITAPAPTVTKITGPIRFGRPFQNDCELSTSVAFAPDSHDVLVLRDGTVEKWRPGHDKPVSTMGLSLPPKAPSIASLTDGRFAFTPEGRFVIAALGSGHIVWSTTSPKPIAISLDPKDEYVGMPAVSTGGALAAFQKVVGETPEQNEVELRVTIRRLPNLTKTSAFEWTASGGQASLLFVGPDLLLTTDYFFRGFHFFDSSTGAQLELVEQKNHDASGWPPALASMGSSLAVSGPKAVCLFDVAQPSASRPLLTKRACVDAPQLVMLEMSRDGQRVVGADESRHLHLWDLRNPKQHFKTASVVEPPYGDPNVHEEERGGRLIDLAISADGTKLATTGHCGTFGMMWTVE